MDEKERAIISSKVEICKGKKEKVISSMEQLVMKPKIDELIEKKRELLKNSPKVVNKLKNGIPHYEEVSILHYLNEDTSQVKIINESDLPDKEAKLNYYLTEISSIVERF